MVSTIEIWVQHDNPTTLRPQLQHNNSQNFLQCNYQTKNLLPALLQKFCISRFETQKHISLFTSLLITMVAICTSCIPIINRDRAVCSHTNQRVTETEHTSQYLHYSKKVFSNKQLKKKVIYMNNVQKYQTLFLSWAYRIYLRNLVCDFVQNTGLWLSFIRGRKMATCSQLLHVAASVVTMTCTAACTLQWNCTCIHITES